jgi:hypothetical protein
VPAAGAPGPALLLVRPTGVAICAADGADAHLAGTVTDAAFRGRGYEHAVDVPGHGRLTGVFAAVRADRGSRVGLRLDPAGCHVFPESAGANGPGPEPGGTEGTGGGEAAGAPGERSVTGAAQARH